MSEAPLTPATDEELSGWVSCAMIAGDNGQDENASLTHRDVLRVMEAVHRDRAELSSLRERLGRAREVLKLLVDQHEYKTPSGNRNCRYCDNNMDHEGTYENMHADDCPVRKASEVYALLKEDKR